jgi:hypothetical protein
MSEIEASFIDEPIGDILIDIMKATTYSTSKVATDYWIPLTPM